MNTAKSLKTKYYRLIYLYYERKAQNHKKKLWKDFKYNIKVKNVKSI